MGPPLLSTVKALIQSHSFFFHKVHVFSLLVVSPYRHVMAVGNTILSLCIIQSQLNRDRQSGHPAALEMHQCHGAFKGK